MTYILSKKIYSTLFFMSLSIYMVGRVGQYTVYSEQYDNWFILFKTISYIPLSICLFYSFCSLCITKEGNIKLSGLKLAIFEALLILYALVYDVNAGFSCMSFSICVNFIDTRKLFVFIGILLSILFMIALLSGIGINNTFARKIGDLRVRYSFSFFHPYTMQVIWMSIVSIRILLKKKLGTIEFVSLIILTIIFNIFGGTRSAYIATMLLLIMNHTISCVKRIAFLITSSQILKLFINHFYLCCFIFINALCLFMLYYDNSLMQSLDYLFTGRLSMTARYINGICDGSIPLLPTTNTLVDPASLYLPSLALDSEYSQLLFGYGLIYSILFIVIMDKMLRKALNDRQWSIVCILIAIALNSLMEPTILSVLYNPCILLSVKVLYEKNKNILYNGH